MVNADIVTIIISTIIGLLLIIMGLVLFNGRGTFLIAGFNTLSKEEKEKYDTNALSRFIGKILVTIGLITPLFAVGAIYEIGWLSSVYTFCVIGLSIFAIIYSNTGNRFRK